MNNQALHHYCQLSGQAGVEFQTFGSGAQELPIRLCKIGHALGQVAVPEALPTQSAAAEALVTQCLYARVPQCLNTNEISVLEMLAKLGVDVKGAVGVKGWKHCWTNSTHCGANAILSCCDG